ncbi:MAG TPA: biotin/lipoyl-binding protein [Anaerolineales bacterium]|nr:biotin/lipoyl-binding protein [Anaerolineales bacterium]
MFKNKKIRNWIITVVAVVVVIALALRIISPTSAAAPTTNGAEKVVALELAETIEASGRLDVQPFASLAWKTSGVVESVNVQPGDMVRAGDVLLAWQPSSTSASIVAAQADLINAQEALERPPVIGNGSGADSDRFEGSAGGLRHGRKLSYKLSTLPNLSATTGMAGIIDMNSTISKAPRRRIGSMMRKTILP